MTENDLPPDWRACLAEQFRQPYFAELRRFLDAERVTATVFPPRPEVFAAFEQTPLDAVKVLMLGQDPYHDDGQAHGLCFSVRPGVKPPPSLSNMFKEMRDDLGIGIPDHGCLSAWAEQGVLLLNAVLTVRAHEANSHKNRGWEQFTDAVIKAVSDRVRPVVFVLWGGYAKKKKKLIDTTRHVVIESAHPSPLSAHAGFFGSRPYSKINAALGALGHEPIDWRLLIP
jgi:uracil-DNA glycosylase